MIWFASSTTSVGLLAFYAHSILCTSSAEWFNFIRVYDEGGTVWERKRTYATIGEALRDAEQTIAAWIKGNA